MKQLTHSRNSGRINPYKHIAIRAKIDRRAIDGDSALLNRFVLRSNVTVGRMEEIHELLSDGELDRKIAHWELLDLAEDVEVSFNMLTDEQKEEVRAKYVQILGIGGE